MKRIKPLQIFEINRYSKWIEENPDSIKNFSDVDEPSSFDGDEKKLFSKLSIGGEDYHKILDTLKKNNPSLFLSLKKIDEKDVEKIGDGKREDYYEYKETTIFNLLCDGYSRLSDKFKYRDSYRKELI
jgi:methyltransferase-like protein